MFKPRGIIPPIITPFDEAGRINYPVYADMIEHLIEEGVHGVFPFGTTGEFYAVSDEEYEEMLRFTVKAVDGRVAVYAGANDITTRGVIRKILICERIDGINALSILTPMFISQTQEEIYNHYRTIAESTSLPIIVYNNKPKTNVTVTPSTMARLAKIPNIIAVKDSTGDFTNTAEYIRLTEEVEDFSVLVGRDTLIYAGLCSGATGSIASCANVAPRLVVEIYEKFLANDLEGALDAQMRLNPLRIATGMGTFPEVIKEALVLEGYPVGKCLEPIGPLTQEERDQLRSVLKTMGLI